jgi:hypothetical protein
MWLGSLCYHFTLYFTFLLTVLDSLHSDYAEMFVFDGDYVYLYSETYE